MKFNGKQVGIVLLLSIHIEYRGKVYHINYQFSGHQVVVSHLKRKFGHVFVFEIRITVG